jgi:predicted lipoprotein with Yx(FWY)xxD motif
LTVQFEPVGGITRICGGEEISMKTTILLLGATVAAVGTLAACGGGSTGPAAGGGAPAGTAIAVHDVSGVGQTLVDASGKTLYFADQEAGGMIKCTGNCLSFWMPATGTAADTKAVSGLGTMKRSDTSADQLTFQGKPLYTFKLDTGAGQAKGNNFSDAFSGTSFTWHAATTTAAAPTTSPSQSSGGGGGYGY